MRDDPEQERIAEAVLQTPVLLIPTVVLEIVYVLQGRDWSRGQISDGLMTLLELETLIIREEEAFRWTVSRYRTGGAFADMYNVALSRDAESFVTFDKRVERYTRGGPVPVETL